MYYLRVCVYAFKTCESVFWFVVSKTDFISCIFLFTIRIILFSSLLSIVTHDVHPFFFSSQLSLIKVHLDLEGYNGSLEYFHCLH